MKEGPKDLGKFSVIYEDETSISIWKYDKSKSTTGPVDVEYKWKKNFNPWENSKKKTLGDLVKEQKTKRSVKN